MVDKTLSTVVGVSGLGIAEMASTVEIPTSANTSEIVKVVVQLIIGLVTLFGLFRPKQKSIN